MVSVSNQCVQGTRIALAFLITSVCLLQGCMLHHSAASIRSALLKQTPIGTNYDSVEAAVKNQGWKWQQFPWTKWAINNNSKTVKMAAGPPTEELSKVMIAYLGSTSVLPVSQWEVTAYWVFRSNGTLVDIWVYKRLISL